MIGTRFILDPSAAAEAVLAGRPLLVSVWGDRLQFHRVEVLDKGKTIPPTEAAAKAMQAMGRAR